MFEAKKVLSEAWEMVDENRRHLFWYGFLPSFFSIGVGAVIIYFQALLLKNSSIFSDKSLSFLDIIEPIVRWILSPQNPTSFLIVSAAVFFVAAYVLPVFCQGAIIGMTKEYYLQTKKMERGFGKGMTHFLPLFELSLIKHSIQPFSVFLEFLFLLRVLGTTALVILQPLFWIVFVMGILFSFFFLFASQKVVIEKNEVGDSLIASAKFVGKFLPETIKIFFLILLIELRVAMNVLIIFLLPFIIISIGGLIAHDSFGMLAEISVFLILLSLAAFVSGILFVYINIAWSLAFLKLKEILDQEEA